MNNHLILISRECIIGSEINETSNLIYIEIKIRTKKCDGEYIKNEDYPHLVIVTGKDFKKMYWKMFPKEEKIVKPKIVKPKKERTHKVCSLCKKKLPVKDFYLRQNKQLFSRCKKCVTSR